MRSIACIGVLLLAASLAQAGKDTGGVQGKLVAKDRGGGRAVVYLAGGAGSTAAPARRRISQKDLKFLPDFTVVVKGTTIDFPNEDRREHNVFSNSPPAKDLDLGRYKKGPGKSYTFNKAGEVTLGCHIHPDMKATVLVLENEHFSETSAGGKFKIEGVPAGTYELVVWVPGEAPTSTKVTIEAGKTVSKDLTIPRSATQVIERKYKDD